MRAIGPYLVLLVASSAHAQTERALQLFRQDEARAAIEALDDAAVSTQGADRARALNAKGWILYTQGKSVEAASTYGQALSEAESSRSAELERKILNNLGINYFVVGNLTESERAFRQAKSRGSVLADRYIALISRQQQIARVNGLVRDGVEHRLKREFREAIEDYSSALAIDPDNNDALAYRGYAHFRLGEYELAHADLEQAQRDNPGRLDVVINLVKVNCASGIGPRAEDVIAANRALVEDNPRAFANDNELQNACRSRLDFDAIVGTVDP